MTFGSKGNGKVRYYLFLVALLLSSSMIIADGIIMPAVNGLYEMFPNDRALVDFVVTGDYLFVVFLSVLAGRLCERVSKKWLIVFGGAMMSVGGVLMGVVPNPLFMCAMRFVQSFGIAFSQVCGVSLISEKFDGEERSRVTGWYYAAMYFTGALMGPVAGHLAVESPLNACEVFWMFVPITIMVALFVPKDSPRAAGSGPDMRKNGGVGLHVAAENVGKRRHYGRAFWGMALCYIAMYYVLTVRLAYTSVYVAENGLGSSADAGNLEAVYTVFGFFGCFVATRLASRLKSFTLPFAFGCYLLAFILMSLLPSLIVCVVAYALCGMGLGIMQTHIYACVPSIVPAGSSERAIAVLVSGTAVTSFLSSYLVSAAMFIMGTNCVTDTFVVPTAVTALVVAVSLVEHRRWDENADKLPDGNLIIKNKA